jgi:hypothetical protein
LLNTAHRHGDIATERLESEKDHAFIFIPVPIFKYPVNWPTLMASGVAGWCDLFSQLFQDNVEALEVNLDAPSQ